MTMPNIRFGYNVKKNSFKGLDIDCIQYSNIIRITYYSYSYSGTILNPNIIRIRIRPNICARILFVFVFAHSEKTNIIRIRIRSKFWCRILFVFVFGQKNSIRSPLDRPVHYGIKAMGAMTLRISELYLSFFHIQIFQINEKGSRWAWIRWRRRRKWK